jgi:preprotein translocase subunit SecB
LLPQAAKSAAAYWVGLKFAEFAAPMLASPVEAAKAMAKNKASGEQPKKTNGDGPAQAAPRTASEPASGAKTQPQLTVLAQYIKDLSFESPGAPQSLQGPGQNPQLKVGVHVNAGPKGEEAYEVALQLEVHAKSDQGVIYNVELIYGGLFRLRGVPQDLLQPVLFVDCPTILFPFLRRVLADVIRDGGFPPLMLDPIDFGRLYAQNLAQTQTTAKN